MAAGVVGDHPVARALERPGAHHHIAAGGGEAMEQHHRIALAVVLVRQTHPIALREAFGHDRRF